MLVNPVNAQLTPSESNGKVVWTLDIAGVGSGGPGHYPVVTAIHGQANIPFTYTIVNPPGSTWKFAKDTAALWVSDNGQDPKAPSSVPGQIDPHAIHTSPDGLVLKFVDQNKDPPVTLHYTLNFVNGSLTSSTLDPIIQNGGGGIARDFWASSTVQYVAIALMLLVAALFVRRMFAKQS